MQSTPSKPLFSITVPQPKALVSLKTEKHRKLAERMSLARVKASYPAMSRVEFLAQTPKELRVAKAHGPKPQKRSGER